MLTTDLGRVLVTGGSGFVGANLVTELLGRGHDVRSFDRVPSPLPDHPRLQVVTGDISNVDDVAAAIGSGADAVDTVFHTAAIIDLMGGASVTDEYRQRSFAVNVGGTQNLVRAARAAGTKRFVYTASNSVVMGGQEIVNGDETLPYTERFNDLYTETKVTAEKIVLAENGVEELACSRVRSVQVASGAVATRRCSARSSRTCLPETSRCWWAASTASSTTHTYTT